MDKHIPEVIKAEEMRDLRSQITANVEAMTLDQLRELSARIDLNYSDLPVRRLEKRLLRAEDKIAGLSGDLRWHVSRQDQFRETASAHNAAIRRLATAVIAFASGFVVYVATQIILSLV